MANYYPKFTTLVSESAGKNSYGYIWDGSDAATKLYWRSWDIIGVEAASTSTKTQPDSYSIKSEQFIGYPQSKDIFLKTFLPIDIDGLEFFMNWTLYSTVAWTFTAKLYDGSYDYTSTIDFPPTGILPTKGIGLLRTLKSTTTAAEIVKSEGEGNLISVYSVRDVVDVSSATQSYVTLLIEC